MFNIGVSTFGSKGSVHPEAPRSKDELHEANQPRGSSFPSLISSPNNMNLFRFIFASLVIYAHSYTLLLGVPHYDPLFTATNRQFDNGQMSVDAFFIISGFLITNSFLFTRSPQDYLKKRCLRIFPGLAGAVLFCILVVGPLSGVNLHDYFHNRQTYGFLKLILLHDQMLTLPGVFVHNPFPNDVNGQIWTIRFEFVCYLLVALLGCLGLLKTRGVVTAMFLTALVYAAAFGDRWERVNAWHFDVRWFGDAGEMPRLALYFLAGMAFYLWRERIPRTRLLFALSLLALFLGHWGYLNVAAALGGTYAIFYLAYSPRLKFTRFGTRHDLSYGIYLYGLPVQQLLIEHYQHQLTPITLCLIALAISIGLAFLSWEFIEHPAMKLKTKSLTNVR